MYLGRLPYHVREDDVERFVKGFGRVRDIMLKNGYGFVVSTPFSIYLHFARGTQVFPIIKNYIKQHIKAQLCCMWVFLKLQ